MNKNTKQSTENLLANGLEILGKRNANSDGKNALVVDLLLDPVHEQSDVLGRGQMRGLLVGVVVAPQVLVLGPARHHHARLLGAVVRHDAVQQVDAVEEVHYVHGYPVVELLAYRQLHRLAQVNARAQCLVGVFVQAVAKCARFELFLRAKRLFVVFIDI